MKLTAATVCLSLAAAHQGPVIHSGENLFTVHESNLHTNNPLDPTSTHHILESKTTGDHDDLCHGAFIRKMSVECFDHVEDTQDEDWSHIPTSVLAHQVSHQPQCHIDNADNEPKLKVVKERHVCVKTCWKNDETS